MKKVGMLVLAVAMLFVGMVGVRAEVTEADLVRQLKDTYTINGAKFTVSNDVKVLIDRYAADYDITNEDAAYISSRVSEVVKLIEDAGITDMKDLGKIKSQLVEKFELVVAHTAIRGTYKDGKFIIYKPDTTGTSKNDVFAIVDSLVKQTGTESNAIAILAGVSFVVMVAGAFVIVRKVRFN